MPTLAVTGHMDLGADTVALVRRVLRRLFDEWGAGEEPLVGVSCLAAGADTVFAQVLLDAGGSLTALIPSRDYRAAHVPAEHTPDFDRLLAAADDVVVLPAERAGREAYDEANAALVARADLLVAIWDGAPPSGRGGGMADAVATARAAGVPVRLVWPPGAVRGSAEA
ncbi:hypothetical protein [Catenulispora subtropica]|uniref:Uncharacterized protein n=1 Tax=Catenulispora subtropica TaxID=450798 RepID=A0ABP5CCY2_9ACTN